MLDCTAWRWCITVFLYVGHRGAAPRRPVAVKSVASEQVLQCYHTSSPGHGPGDLRALIKSQSNTLKHAPLLPHLVHSTPDQGIFLACDRCLPKNCSAIQDGMKRHGIGIVTCIISYTVAKCMCISRDTVWIILKLRLVSLCCILLIT